MGSRSTTEKAGPGRRAWFHAAVALAGAASTALAPISTAWAQDAPISLIRDTEVEGILHRDADPIFRAAGIDPKAVTIYIVGDDDMNAFVSGGQNLFVFTGLIERTKTPNQLIGVMAHETGHMAGGHLIRSAQGEKQELATYLLTMGLGVLAAAAGSPDAAAGLLYSSGYFAALTGAGFTRTQEASADQAALTYLEKAGMSGKGIVDFFDNFRYEEVFENARRYKFFQDHPITSERIEALRIRAEQQPHYGVVDTPQAQAEHEVMVAKLKAFENLPQQTLIDYPETDVSFPARYARAIAYYRDLQTDRALTLINALIAEQPNNPYLWELKGQTLFESGHPADAEPAHRRSVELKPDAPLLRVNLAQSLVAEENPQKLQEAVAELHHAVIAEPDNAYAWMLMAQAYDHEGQPGMARLASAEQEYSLGQLSDAKVFAMRARRQLARNSPEWRRATDIVLVSKPSKEDLQALAQEGSVATPVRR
ncbi:MAG TPA: M48 family metalloprotease [Caulobacteraceae bacterium]|jgi:predicted Zn-dependent protease|nr:M48 family metalloprotease [Caulobacteraceae bacterium]